MTSGTLAYDNWQMARAGHSPAEAFEYPLYSDSVVTGEFADQGGPYELFNAANDSDVGSNAVRMFLRFANYGERPLDDLTTQGSRHYHGGLIPDEISALLSLCLGVRLKPGPSTRMFQPRGDPRGRPHAYLLFGERHPVFMPASGAAVIPQIVRSVDLAAAELFLRFHELTPALSVSVARAARLYQDAIWIAESEPELAWVLLTSAVETAAAASGGAKEGAVETVRCTPYGAALEEMFVEHGQPQLFAPAAAILAPMSGATKKFREFLLEFSAPPPQNRAEAHYQIDDWGATELRRAYSKIYAHRSNALHNGTPFPAPMCWPARRSGDGYAEKLPGGWAGARGASWKISELAMFLWTFEYLVRYALLAWWQQLVDQGRP